MFGVMGKHVFRHIAVTFYPRGGVKSNSEGAKIIWKFCTEKNNNEDEEMNKSRL